VEDYDGLILPGGVANPDNLRLDEGAVRFVQDFFATGKPVGVICHGPWTLIEADVARGRTLTSYPSIRTDLRNAGAEVVSTVSLSVRFRTNGLIGWAYGRSQPDDPAERHRHRPAQGIHQLPAR
jgi:putative intracellular protease/amidase